MTNNDGIFLIDKSIGFTSHDVCAKAKRILGTKRIGHCGTLDPFASGLLIICINEATKIVRFIEDSHKCYIATLKLGEETDTLDRTGNIINSINPPTLKEEEIINVLNSFKGKISQIPPKYSAIHIDGRKAYEYARDGIDIEIPSREVTINSIELISYKDNCITFKCDVSKGTYIRVLGSDIASKLNTIGHLIELRRISIGNYKVEDAISFNDLNYQNIIPLDSAINWIKKIYLDESYDKYLNNGQAFKFECNEKLIAVYNSSNKLKGIYERNNKNIYTCLRGFN